MDIATWPLMGSLILQEFIAGSFVYIAGSLAHIVGNLKPGLNDWQEMEFLQNVTAGNLDPVSVISI